MQALLQGIKRFVRDEEGVTMVEYGLIAALIAVVCIAAVKVIGTQLDINLRQDWHCAHHCQRISRAVVVVGSEIRVGAKHRPDFFRGGTCAPVPARSQTVFPP